MTALEAYYERTGLRYIVVSDVPDPETGEPDPYFGRCAVCRLGGTCTDCSVWGTDETGRFVEYDDNVPFCTSCRLEAEYGPDSE